MPRWSSGKTSTSGVEFRESLSACQVQVTPVTYKRTLQWTLCRPPGWTGVSRLGLGQSLLSSPWHYPFTAGCNPPSMSSIAFCLLLSCSRWFPPSLVCRLAIFCLVVLSISSLFLVATLCSVLSTYCLLFLILLCPAHLHFCFSVYFIMSIIFVLFLISEHGILSCSFRPNILFSVAL